MNTNEILELRRAEMRLMEIGAAALKMMSKPLDMGETADEIEAFRKQFDITVKMTRTVTGSVRRFEDYGQVHSLNFITVIKWVREVSRSKNLLTGEETIMGLGDAKKLVESWVGKPSFEIPREWGLSLWPLPAGFEVVD